MSLEPGWDQVDSISTDDTPVAVNGYESIYDTGVAFKLVWDASQSPLNVPWEAFTPDQWFYQSHQFLAGQQGEEYFLVPARLYSPAEFTVQAFDPQTSNLLLERSHTESIVEINTGFPTFLDNCPVEQSMVEDWSEQLGDLAISSFCSQFFAPEFIADKAMEYNLSESEVEDMINNVESEMQQTFRPVWRSWASKAYGLQHRYVIRVGSGHPLLGDASTAVSSVPQGIYTGLSVLKQPGQTWQQVVPEVVSFNVNTSALTQVAVDWVDSVFDSGLPPTISGDTVFLSEVRIGLPVAYDTGTWSVDGELYSRVRDVSFNKIFGNSLDGGLGVTWRRGNISVTISAEAQEVIGSGNPEQFIYLQGGYP